MGIGNGFSLAGDVQSAPPFDCDVGLGLSFSSPYLHRNPHVQNHQSTEIFGFYRNPTNSSYSTIAGGVMGGDTGKVLFTATQWQELERQKKIYMYIMASIPVPPHLLLPLSTQSNKVSLRYSYGSDPEPWRCRRTDGKKWRCAKDVAPDQKYCERHAHKTRARSRKPVEAQSHNIKENPSVISTANQQTRCSDWFLKNGTIPMSESHNQFQQPMSVQDFKGNHQQNSYINTTGTDIDPWSRIGSGDECALTLSMQSGGNGDAFDHESFQLAVGLLSGNREGCGDGFKPHHSWLNQASWAGSGSSSDLGLTPGGPLGEALCLGVTSTQHEPFSDGKSYCTSTGGSCESGGGQGVDFGFVNPHDG